jgi:hypothetical protein
MKIVEEPMIDYQIKFEIVSAKIVSGYKIQVRFKDGDEKIIDFEPFLSNSHHPSIRKYLDPSKFKQFEIVHGNLNWNDYDLIFPLSDLRNGQIS